MHDFCDPSVGNSLVAIQIVLDIVKMWVMGVGMEGIESMLEGTNAISNCAGHRGGGVV